jgi:hypothetical protein
MIDVSSPTIAYNPNERRARLTESNSEAYPMIDVHEHSATAGPTSISEEST